MSAWPLDGETRARVLADHRNRRGPFAQPVVAPHELVSHYTVARIKATQARALLREVCAREVKCPFITLFVAHPDAVLQAMTAAAVRVEYLKARGLPHT